MAADNPVSGRWLGWGIMWISTTMSLRFPGLVTHQDHVVEPSAVVDCAQR